MEEKEKLKNLLKWGKQEIVNFSQLTIFKKTPAQMFDWVLKMLLTRNVLAHLNRY